VSFPLISRKKYDAMVDAHRVEQVLRMTLVCHIEELERQISEAQSQLADLPRRDASGKFKKRA
jgi:hypothetical protein